MYNINSWAISFFLLLLLFSGLGFRAAKKPSSGQTRFNRFLRSQVLGGLTAVLVMALLISYDFFFRHNLRWEFYTAMMIPPIVMLAYLSWFDR